MAHEFTDEELRQVVTYVAVSYLEVERGLRNRTALRSLMSPDAFAVLKAAPPLERRQRGPVRQTDLGRLQFQRPTRDRAFVTMPARECGDDWSALVMQLRANSNGVWRVTEFGRVNERTLASRPRTAPSTPEQRDIRLAHAARDLQAARLALTAVTARHTTVARQLVDAAPRKPAGQLQVGELVGIGTGAGLRWSLVEHLAPAVDGHVNIRTADGRSITLAMDRQLPVAPLADDSQPEAFAALAKRLGDLADEQRIWQRQVSMLGHENAELSRTHAAVHRPEPRRSSGPPAYVVRLLGAPPEDGVGLDAWQQAAGLIKAYRQRWGITTQDSALGPPPNDPYQAHNRDSTIAALRTLSARVRHQVETLENQDPALRQRHELDRSPGQ